MSGFAGLLSFPLLVKSEQAARVNIVAIKRAEVLFVFMGLPLLQKRKKGTLARGAEKKLQVRVDLELQGTSCIQHQP